jgi:AcrR family transcriptional regulator
MPRPYKLGRRKAGVAVTRAKIVEGARDLLMSDEGFRNFTMDGIAREAGVARMTVYNQFESKTAIYEALADDLAARGKIRENISAAFMERDAVAGLGKLIDAFVHFWLSEPDTMRKLHAMSQLDPDSHAAERDAWRLEAIRVIMERLRLQLRRRTGKKQERDIDAVYMLTDFGTCDALARAGRSERQIASRIRDLASDCIGIDIP